MPFRILEYEFEIMRSTMNKKTNKIPLVIPIVLYTGKRKWNKQTFIKEIQEELEGYEGIELGKFNLIDINNYTKMQLLKEDTIYTKIMLAEKSKDKIDLLKNIEKSYNEINKKSNDNIYDEEQRNRYNRIMYEIVKNKIGEKRAQKFFNILINRGGRENMLALYDVIDNENREIFRRGKKAGMEEGKKAGIEEGIKAGMKEGKKAGIEEGIKQVVKNMIKNKIDTKTIINITGLDEKEIDKIKGRKGIKEYENKRI